MVLEMFAYIAELKKEVWVMMEIFLKLKSIYINCTGPDFIMRVFLIMRLQFNLDKSIKYSFYFNNMNV